MMRAKSGSGVLSLLCKPLLVLLILVSLFSLVRLRSAVLAVNYDIRNLEEKKTEALKDMKLLMAERSKYASLEKIAASFRDEARDLKVNSAGNNFFGNRVRVIHITRNKGAEPLKTSLETGKEK